MQGLRAVPVKNPAVSLAASQASTRGRATRSAPTDAALDTLEVLQDKILDLLCQVGDFAIFGRQPPLESPLLLFRLQRLVLRLSQCLRAADESVHLSRARWRRSRMRRQYNK